MGASVGRQCLWRSRSESSASSIVLASASRSASLHIASQKHPTCLGRTSQPRRQGTPQSMGTSWVRRQQKCWVSRACFAPLGGFFSNGALASNHVIVDLLASFVTDESAYSLCARTLSALGACRAIDVAKDVFPRQGAVSI